MIKRILSLEYEDYGLPPGRKCMTNEDCPPGFHCVTYSSGGQTWSACKRAKEGIEHVHHT